MLEVVRHKHSGNVVKNIIRNKDKRWRKLMN